MPPWDPRLETGIKEIDDQHRKLFAKIDALVEAVNNGTSKVEVEKLLDFLLDYAIRHFSTEETIMEGWDYPDLDAHKREHIEISEELIAIEDSFQRTGATSLIRIKLSTMVRQWLRQHIGESDQKLATYLKKALTKS